MSITSALYKAARLSADGRAVSKGPKGVAKRASRREVYKNEGKATRRFLRNFGL